MNDLLPPIPAARAPRPATEVKVLTGRRVQIAEYDPLTEIVSWAPDYRAASEVYEENGRLWVNVARERHWYAWVNSDDPKPARCPKAFVVHASSVLAE